MSTGTIGDPVARIAALIGELGDASVLIGIDRGIVDGFSDTFRTFSDLVGTGSLDGCDRIVATGPRREDAGADEVVLAILSDILADLVMIIGDATEDPSGSDGIVQALNPVYAGFVNLVASMGIGWSEVDCIARLKFAGRYARVQIV